MSIIGLISDVHASPEPVQEALSIFSSKGVNQVYCMGDIAGYHEQLKKTVSLLRENHCHSILGNHDLLYLEHHDEERDNEVVHYLKQLPTSIEIVIDDKRLYIVHAEPADQCHGGIKLLDKEGRVLEERVQQWEERLRPFCYDVLVVGHTHQVFAEKIGKTLVINPGSSIFNHCCAILRLPDLEVEMIALSGKKIRKTWNWGEHVLHTN